MNLNIFFSYSIKIGKSWKRQLPFRNDDGIFEEDFIEDRKKGLEQFINKGKKKHNLK